MKIAVDIRGSQRGFKDHLHRGIGRFVLGLAPRLPGLMTDVDFYFLVDAGLSMPEMDIPERVKIVSCGKHLPSIGKFEIIRTQFSVRSKLIGIKPDITLFFCHEDGLLGWPKSAVFVYDLIPYNFPNLYGIDKDPRRKFKMALVKRIACAAELIFTISENSRYDIERFWKIPQSRISVVYAAIDTDKFKPQAPDRIDKIKINYKLPQKYLLYVGGIDARKNVPNLLDAFARIVDHLDGVGLVIAGKIDNQKECPALLKKIAALGLADKVCLPGFIDDADLPAVYSGAEATVFPSLYEGFGLPALESLSCGTPLVASKRSAIPEAVGDIAVYCDVESPKDLADAIKRALCDESLKERFKIEGPLQASKFSWDKVASKIAGSLNHHLILKIPT
jgi:glycosyltransferase involved in cell wall biosynthesis